MRMFQGPSRRIGGGGRSSGGRHDPWKDSRLGKGSRWEDDRFSITKLPHNGLMINGYEKQTNDEPLTIPYPKEIVSFLDQFVIGQELAKKTLAVGVYQHYKRIEFNIQKQEDALLELAMKKSIQRKDRDRVDQVMSEDLKLNKGFTLSRDPDEDIVMEKSNIVLLGILLLLNL